MIKANLTGMWDGNACIDNRLFSQFTGGSGNTNLKGSLFSTRAQITFEMWVRDKNAAVSNTQVLFENTNDQSGTPLVQISTISSTVSTSRSFSCIP